MTTTGGNGERPRTRLSLIVAIGEGGVMGAGGGLPWRLPADLAHFKRLTLGHHILMGRKTWDSIGRPLPGRTSVVLSRDPSLELEGAIVVGSLEEALALAREAGDDEPFVIGGAEIYRLAMDRVDRIWLTRVHASFEGDTFFDEPSPAEWREVSRERHEPDDRNSFTYEFLCLDRVGAPSEAGSGPSGS